MALNGLLVTGGAGFIGSAVVRRLVASGREPVINLDKLTYAGNLDSLAAIEHEPSYTFVEGDIRDAELVRQILERHRPRAILHLAAESHVDRSIDEPAEFLQTNVVGTYTLLAEALRYWRALPASDAARFRFLHVSTDEVFGSLGPTGHFSETTRYRPTSPYSASKASSDHFVRAWHHTYALPAIVTNCSNNYGPYQFPEKLIPLMIQKAVAGQPLPVYGSGENVRDWLFVEDHVDALLAALEHGRIGDTYAIGGGAERRNIEVVRSVCRLLDDLLPALPSGPRERLITLVKDRPGHDQRYAIDSSKIQRELGWRASHSFDEGLRHTVEWYLANQAWSGRVQSGAYRGERLGLGGVA